MNKVNNIFETKKVETWKLLKSIRSLIKFITFVFFWIATIITIIFCWGMVNNTNNLIDFVAGEPLYFKVMGNMILMPFKICFVFFIINICIGVYMRFIAQKMDEYEMIKAGIKSPIKNFGEGIRLQTDIWKENAKKVDDIKSQITILKSWMRTIRLNPYIDTSTKIDICNEIRMIWISAKVCKSYIEVKRNNEEDCNGNN